ncbi:MAG: Gfo/Idh/MocA family protein, partial [Bryobacteraceae bacterium]
IENSLEHLKRSQKIATHVKVEERNWFLGLDAYQRLIDSGVDVVLLATPPGFRPLHVAACVAANKHIFCEKPAAVDAWGIRSVLDSAEKAAQKRLSLVAGFCWRYNNMLQETMRQIHEGAIGKLVAYYATYYTNTLKVIPPENTRPAGMSDVEWQIRNWYNFVWLSGDSLVEQAVHSADKIAWAMQDEPPLSCVGVGGRAIPSEGGNIYDHFEINYLYPNGTRAFLASRQIDGCYDENSDYVLGGDGISTFGRGPIARIAGKTNWAWTGKTYNMYQREHDVLFAAIRKGQPVNDGKRLATSTMLAIMGRMAAYTGQQVTWDQALESREKRFPDNLDWNGTHPVAPRAQPGITKLL